MSEDAVMVPKSPSSFGKKKYAVEVFITERHVVNVYTNNKRSAREKAEKAFQRTTKGFLRVKLREGIESVHFDSDYNFTAKAGGVEDVTEDA